jgi:ATP-binding cassette subfamily C (CFTR/MRP) protein 4
VLSPLAASVGRCICQALHEKITILVTHQLQYLKAASHILILKDVSNSFKKADSEFVRRFFF